MDLEVEGLKSKKVYSLRLKKVLKEDTSGKEAGNNE
jgi:hypothetical protein